ncbi:hypothetical protein AAHA92_01865 [Salvia divinorum]|uniref:Retrotransposon Copia-like N-terminal domain-containing protein n=1 Tax=Salvia divinorum TaxID=28513 RepID=A0ABD1IBY8_SALDI
MSDSNESSSETTNNSPNMMNFSAEFAAQFAEFMRQSLSSSKTPPQQPNQPESLGDIHLKTKLNGDNYPLWANLMERAIGGKGLTSHITGVSDPPQTGEPTHTKWQQRDHCCFNWIINNIEADLVNEVSQYATARDLWDGLAIIYGSGADPFQVYDLYRQANVMRQGNMTLEALWNRFQDLWISIDARDPSPLTIPSQIELDNKRTQRFRLYQFLAALDDKHDVIKREIMNKDPLPNVRTAYGIVRRAALNERVMKPGETRETSHPSIGTGLASIDRS